MNTGDLRVRHGGSHEEGVRQVGECAQEREDGKFFAVEIPSCSAGHSRRRYVYVMRRGKCQSSFLVPVRTARTVQELIQVERLLIFGASTRAAAFSALRAGLRPWCADLFADRDLTARCPAVRVSASDYPRAFTELARQRLEGPWIYTGGLENRRKLVRQIAQLRPLWGNDDRALRLCRSPQFVTSLLSKEGLPHARLRA